MSFHLAVAIMIGTNVVAIARDPLPIPTMNPKTSHRPAPTVADPGSHIPLPRLGTRMWLGLYLKSMSAVDHLLPKKAVIEDDSKRVAVRERGSILRLLCYP